MAFDVLPRVDAIWRHPTYQAAMRQIERAERERVYCRHGFDHCLDVARIAWVAVLEEGLGLPRDLVYAAALLHDVGRAAEYACGEPHDAASVRIARDIMGTVEEDVAFSAQERNAICYAIAGHRGSGASEVAVSDPSTDHAGTRAHAGAQSGAEARGHAGTPDRACTLDHLCAPDDAARVPVSCVEQLADVLRRADNLSRPCYACAAQAGCYWPRERKNLSIRV